MNILKYIDNIIIKIYDKYFIHKNYITIKFKITNFFKYILYFGFMIYILYCDIMLFLIIDNVFKNLL